MKAEEKVAIIEAVLFLDTEPLLVKNLSKIAGLSEDDVLTALLALEKKCDLEDSGIELVRIGEAYTLAPKEKFYDVLKEKYGRRNENRLSRAAIETLSIIAYSQPITKPEIENIRGVSADGMMRVLMDRNLIKNVGKKDVPGKPLQYGTTKEFLKYFRISSIADLPKLDDLTREKFELED